MAKKTSKSKKIQKCNGCEKSVFCHPSTWLITILAVALVAVCGISAYGFKKLETRTELETAKMEVFDHLAESYIREMEFTINYDQPAITQATGYGVSDEDGVFYITFDYAPYPAEGTVISSMDDLDFKHGIVYFWQDTERGTYGHAFSYHDDDYHPGGEYYKL